MTIQIWMIQIFSKLECHFLSLWGHISEICKIFIAPHLFHTGVALSQTHRHLTTQVSVPECMCKECVYEKHVSTLQFYGLFYG